MYKTFSPTPDWEEMLNRPSKSDSNSKGKRNKKNKNNNKNKAKRTNNLNRNRNRANASNRIRRRNISNDFSIFVDSSSLDDDDVTFNDITLNDDKDKSIASLFSSLHNIQNQLHFKRQDETSMNIAKLKQVPICQLQLLN